MKKRFLFLAFFAILNLSAYCSDTIRIYNSLTINNVCQNISKLVMLLPYPESNQYHEVVGHRHTSDGIVLQSSDHQSYLRFLYLNSQLANLTGFTVSDTFDIVYKEVSVPFSTIDPNAQYDTESYDYQYYLGDKGVFIKPHHPYIDSIANMIWATSDHSVTDYAYKCYEYVAQTLTYHLYSEGLLPLDTVIARQGGECGDFTTLYINLLRNKEIPSRHVAAFTGDGQFHVWAEFLLPGYGWVPVDATYKNGNPDGNFFGEYHEHYIVAHFGVNMDVYCDDNTYLTVTLLQNFAWWYWYNQSQCPGIDVERLIWSEPSPGPLSPLSPNSVATTQPADLFDISIHNRQVEISAPGSRRTDIFDVTGRLVTRLHGENGTAHLNSRGIYIIKAEGYPARKILVY